MRDKEGTVGLLHAAPRGRLAGFFSGAVPWRSSIRQPATQQSSIQQSSAMRARALTVSQHEAAVEDRHARLAGRREG